MDKGVGRKRKHQELQVEAEEAARQIVAAAAVNDAADKKARKKPRRRKAAHKAALEAGGAEGADNAADEAADEPAGEAADEPAGEAADETAGEAADETAGAAGVAEAPAGACAKARYRCRPKRLHELHAKASDEGAERSAAAVLSPTKPKKDKEHKSSKPRGAKRDADGRRAAAASESPMDERATAMAPCDAATAAAPTSAPPGTAERKFESLIVQVFGGKYCSFQHEHLEDMDSAALLKALAKDDTFRDTLAGVPQDKCTVCVGSSTSDGVPKPAEEAAAVELEGAKRVKKLAGGLASTENLFIRVLAPAAPVTVVDKILREGVSVEDVYALLAPAAKVAVDAAREHRSKLAAVLALKQLTAKVKSANASDLGITVLREVGGIVRVGMFDIPRIDVKIMPAPKTFDDLSVKPQKLLLLPQRLELALELVNAVEKGRPLGVLLSGPNGVGKSAAALLAYLVCAARGLPAIYISKAEAWVDESCVKGGGDAFLLQTFWQQNADLIIEKPALRKVFVDVLQDAPSPFTKRVMKALRKLVRTPELRGLAVICDEVQNITAEVKASLVAEPAAEVQRAGRYFATSWHTWTNANSDVFQRMSVGSAHAERDTKLPDGEMHRLRIMEPLHPEDRAALQAHPESPAYVKDASARERVVYIAGNILRKLVMAAKLLLAVGIPTKADMELLWQNMWASMMKDCSAWLDSLPEQERTTASRTVMQLISGKVPWGDAPTLYDVGIVYRMSDPKNLFLWPVSQVAAAVLLRVTSRHISISRTRLSSIADGRERGFELERQVLAKVDSFASEHGVPAKLLDGSAAPYVDLRCSYSLPFSDIREVVPRDVPILYRPTSGVYACDGIRMPAAGDPDRTIWLLECSTVDPVSAYRVNKVLKWFGPDGVATVLVALLDLKVAVALFYDALLPRRERDKLSDEARALSYGKARPVAPAIGAAAGGAGAGVAAGELGNATRVVDRDSLARSLGLLV